MEKLPCPLPSARHHALTDLVSSYRAMHVHRPRADMLTMSDMASFPDQTFPSMQNVYSHSLLILKNGLANFDHLILVFSLYPDKKNIDMHLFYFPIPKSVVTFRRYLNTLRWLTLLSATAHSSTRWRLGSLTDSILLKCLLICIDF